ncbi:universal stress protein [Streptomyces scabiei]|uniref:universal stress protein n=1 Tax=Streptomyces scabiei TaxID=1930 RepID=UPI00298F753C|nr:universal stress protein [Streptomyces scabiei]MDW8808410.1 universal stress protein [Streptomyces scabiei]
MNATRPSFTPTPDATTSVARRRFPVAAVLADRLDDTAVVDLAVGLASARGAPLLLIAVMPAPPPGVGAVRPDSMAARAVMGRAIPRLARAGMAHRPAVHHRPAVRGGGRLHAAKALLDTAVQQGCSLLVVSRSGPAGLDACTVMEAAAIRGGPFVHAASPVPWAPLAARRPGR